MIAEFGIAVFPFLKTSRAVSIGGLTFRPTDETEGLTPSQAASVREISEMLFLQNDLRIRSSTFAITPYINLGIRSPAAEKLAVIQSIVAYMYCSPHEILGHPFLSTEHSSVAIFVPERVTEFLVSPDFNVDHVEGAPAVVWDKHHYAEGYGGLYNFKHPFWVARGSRLYGPTPHPVLNHSQDLFADIDAFVRSHRTQLDLLLGLLDRPETAVASRILTAVRWFNEAHKDANSEDIAVLNLATAFEALFALPPLEKTDQLVDAISLVLGRTARLDLWARQFYDARSRVVHEGRAHQLRFVTPSGPMSRKGAEYQPLLSFGTHIFRLCLSTLLVGADLAETSGLADQFITNEEQFEHACRILADERESPAERLAAVGPLVDLIEQYRLAGETGLKTRTILGAVRLAARTLLASGSEISATQRVALEKAAQPNDASRELESLKATMDLKAEFSGDRASMEAAQVTVSKLAETAWIYLFQLYHWLRERQGGESR